MSSANVHTVFADVDDTIIRGKSLIGFARCLLSTAPPPEALEIDAKLSEVLGKLRAGELARPELNRLFYATVLKNRSVEHVSGAVRLWYAEAAENDHFYHAGVCRHLADARARGAEVVLVSGSFAELLEPVARHVVARDMLVTRLERARDRYTGRVVGPVMIGAGKAQAVAAYANAQRLDLGRCTGIGDDITDAPFLRLMGSAYVPEHSDASLLTLARDLRWHVIDD